MKKLAVIALFALLSPVYAETLSGKDILQKIDKNYESDTRVSTIKMIVRGKRAERALTAKSWAQGNEKSFMVYLSPPRDKGTKMLKLKDELWIWTPDTDRIIKIAGHMLRQSMMGSDISYEDFMENTRLAESYRADVTGEEKIAERGCYVVTLTAIKDGLAYETRKLWVDKERFLPLKQELFAKSGKLLKNFVIEDVFQVGGRWYPKKMIFKDALLAGEGTEIMFDSLDFNVQIPGYIFSKAALKK